MSQIETFYEVMRRQGITRRSFLKYCSLTAAALGLGPTFAPQIANAMETKPRTPVLCGCMVWSVPAVPNPLFDLRTRW